MKFNAVGELQIKKLKHAMTKKPKHKVLLKKLLNGIKNIKLKKLSPLKKKQVI